MAHNGTIRVTQVVFDLNGGGMESLVAAMAARFRGGPIVMSAVTLSGREGRVGAAIRADLDQYHVVRPAPVVSMVAPLGVASRIRATRPDVVHLHSGAWYKGALAARLAGVPRIVYTEHGREHHDPTLLRWLDRRASAWTDAVVAVSDRLGEYLARSVGVDPGRICVITNGVDAATFDPGPRDGALLIRLGIPEDALVIGSIGRLESVKGYDRLVDAFARLRQLDLGGRPAFLLLCGDGRERDALEERVRRLGLSGVARLPGWIERPRDAYRLLDVFALTSHSEGASVSLMEALACGTTPVVMDVGANAEIVGPELAAQVVPAGDVDAFVRVAADTLRSEGRRLLAGRAARERVVARYSLDRMLERYEALYRGGALATVAAPA